MRREHYHIIASAVKKYTDTQNNISIRLVNLRNGSVKMNVFVDDRWFMIAKTEKEQETYDIVIVDLLPRASTINVSTVTNILTNVVLETTKIIRRDLRENKKVDELDTGSSTQLVLESFKEEF